MSDCPFCYRARKHEWDEYYPVLDVIRFKTLNPVVQGHMLFLPFIHVEHKSFQSEDEVAHAMEAAEVYANEQGGDFNLIVSSGVAATQSIPHIHVHYVPRADGDGLMLPWHTEAHDAELREQIAREIEAHGEDSGVGAYGTYGPPAITVSDAASIARGKES